MVLIISLWVIVTLLFSDQLMNLGICISSCFLVSVLSEWIVNPSSGTFSLGHLS